MFMYQLLVIAFFIPALFCQSCGKTHPFVGFKTDIGPGAHQVSGTVEIIDDCTLRIHNFRYDGTAPDAFVWAGVENTRTSFIDGFSLSGSTPLSAYTIQTADFVFGPTKTLDDFSAVSIWCRQFNANFASVSLGNGPIVQTMTKKSGNNTISATTMMQPKTMTTEPSIDYENCKSLSPYYNLHWTLEQKNNSLVIGLEIKLENNNWVAFGVSDQSVGKSEMIHSDVTICGWHQDTGFCSDYYITSKSQCNFGENGDSGVCPDSSLGSNESLNNIQFISAEKSSEISMFTFKKPLSSKDFEFDRKIEENVALYSVWATGPLSDDPNLPIILYHGAQNHAPSDFQVEFGKNEMSCKPIDMLPPLSSSDSTTEPRLIFDVTEFECLVKPDRNYPNPPSWGVSWQLNGLETPVVNVVRGKEYIFTIKGGDTHPFYITDSIEGGNANSEEKIFAGDQNSWGTEETPFVLKWVPDANTPDLVYYQCYFHQKLGWKILVSDEKMENSIAPCQKLFFFGLIFSLFFVFF